MFKDRNLDVGGLTFGGGRVTITLEKVEGRPSLVIRGTDPRATLVLDIGKLNITPAAGDPATPSDGDIWYDDTSGLFQFRQEGVTESLSGDDAPVDATFVTASANATLTAELVLGTDVIMQGTAAARPAAGTAGRIYFSTDTNALEKDTGAAWIDLLAGAGGAGHTIRENGTDQTARTGLNFIDVDAGAGLITDDPGGDETEINLSLYRLEAADHSHQSTGPQAGQLDHGLALTGLADDDHTQYIRHAEAPLGQCYLSLSGANLLLDRYNGSALFINGNHEAIPNGGITLAASGLTADTTYLIYAFMSGATMTLEASTTVRATDTTYGHQIKSGDGTRTLVGMARIITGPAWQNTAAQRFIISWFNRRPVTSLNFYTADITLTTPTVFTEFSTSVRNEFLIWSEDIALSWGAIGAYSSATDNWRIAIAYDDTTAEDFAAFPNGSSNSRHTPPFMSAITGLAEGYHFTAVVGIVPSGNLTLDTFANSAGSRPGFMTMVRG